MSIAQIYFAYLSYDIFMNNTIDLNNIPAKQEVGSEKILQINKKRKNQFFKYLLFTFIFLMISASIFIWQMNASSQNGESAWYKKINFLGAITNIVIGSDKKLKGEDLDRINILLLGMGGKNHDGAYLTDTMMLVSLQPSTKKVSMISIPRDLTIPIENMGWRKINSVNAFAENNNHGSGGLATSQAVGDVFDIPIDYYVRVDFDGFINIVDQLGGLDINVENTLDDYSYPILGKEDTYPYESRFEHLHVDTGWQKMDGSLALKFARSRHGIKGEGSDFARSRRQQIILEAVKAKVLSMNVFFKPTMIGNIVNELQEHISTNLKIWEIVKIWENFNKVKSENIINKVLDNGPDGLLVDAISSEGAYILSPSSGDFKEIQYLISNIFNNDTAIYSDKAKYEKPTIEVYNGTWVNGLATQFATDLEKNGFEILRIANSSLKNFQKTVIYDLTFGAKIESLSILKQKTDANVSPELPQWLKDDLKKNNIISNPRTPDFVIVLGHSADNTASGAENNNQ